MNSDAHIITQTYAKLFDNLIVEVLLRSAVLVLLTIALAKIFSSDISMLSLKAILLIHMTIFVIIAFLFFPQNALSRFSVARQNVYWVIVCFISFNILCGVMFDNVDFQKILMLSLAVSLMLCLLMSVTRLFQTIYLVFNNKINNVTPNSHSHYSNGCNNSAAPIVTLLLFFIFASVPIWLGPLAEFSGDEMWFTNSLIAVSPISYFSVILEYDYLRSAWFYKNTPFGSLRFDYLLPLIYSSYIIVLTLTTFILSYIINSTKNNIREKKEGRRNESFI